MSHFAGLVSNSRPKRVFQNQPVCSSTISKLLRITRTGRTQLISQGYPCIGNKRIAVMQAPPLAGYAAIVLPILLVPQPSPWTRQIRYFAPVERGRGVPPTRLQKRGKHRFDPLARALPWRGARRLANPVEACPPISDIAFRMRA